mmetsp:Transcript_54650/g.153756  ORF Transcript_54650/g.153756 Transcript_54650/m.153756 type:complete len:1083 (-) Transcript_54650:85-3333(-)
MSQKLKGIYDALDHGNYKSAIKLCTTFLQKNQGNALCRALQAVALDRCGRRDEAFQLCNDARSSTVGMDDTVLNTLQVVYRRCKRLRAITDMYEAASKQEEDNEDYSVSFFFAAVHEGDFAKAQQAAMTLYRKFKNPNKYIHWVIVPLLLQAQRSGTTKLLDLADMMLKKAPIVVDPRVDGAIPFNRGQLYLLLLHLTTLKMQRKHSQALEMLEEHKEIVKLPEDIARLRIQLLAEASRFQEAADEARSVVLQNIDNWTAVQDYIQLAFKCPAPVETMPKIHVDVPGAEAIDVPDHGARLRRADGSALPSLATLEEATSHQTDDEVWNAFLLFRHLRQREEGVERAGSGRTSRLAELEIRRMAFCMNEAALKAPAGTGWKTAVNGADVAEFISCIADYIDKFGQRGCCYFDLKPFLCILEESEVADAIGGVDQRAPADGKKARDVVATGARLRRAHRRPHSDASLSDGLGEAQSLLGKWAALEEQDEGGAGASSQLQDDLLILAVVTLLDMDELCCRRLQTGDRKYLLDALGLAQMGLSRSPHAFHFKVLLALISGALGLPTETLRWYNIMEIKNIQHESLSYLVFDVLCSAGCSDNIRDCSKNIVQFHEDIDKDGAEALNATFHGVVFHRVPEYIGSLEQVSRSLLWARAVVEDTLSEIGQSKTWEEILECFGRQGVLLSMIASKPADYWLLRNQDRCLLNGFNPLPLCSPLGTSQYTPTSWRGGAAVPTTLVQGARSGTVISAGLMWGGAEQVEDSCSAHAPAAEQPPNPSAVEVLLTRGLQRTPAQLRLSSSLVQVLSALLQRDRADEDRLAEALTAAQEAAASDGIGPILDVGAGGLVARELAKELDANLAACWSAAPARFTALAWRCALTACEAAQAVLHCIASKEVWQAGCTRFTDISVLVRELVDSIRELGRGDDAGSNPSSCRPFMIGHHGVPWLWAFLNCSTTVLIPVVLWCCQTLPKAGSGKKAKTGQEDLHAARVALRALVVTLQTGLADLQTDLGSAHDSDDSALLADEVEGTDAEAPKVAALGDLAEFQRFRAQAKSSVVESHRKHLRSLQEAIGLRLNLLKVRGVFKP